MSSHSNHGGGNATGMCDVSVKLLNIRTPKKKLL